jgi:hypothetical protein
MAGTEFKGEVFFLRFVAVTIQALEDTPIYHTNYTIFITSYMSQSAWTVLLSRISSLWFKYSCIY